MWLRSISADRLRNLKSVDVAVPPGLTVVTGRNGQGKTSLLEAVYLIGTAHSFRTRKWDELVDRQGGPMRIAAEVSGLSLSQSLGLVVDGTERRLLVDGVERALTDFLGRLDLVALTGDGMRTLRDGPEGRRRFVDSGIAGLYPSFLGELGMYRRVLAERNALLSRGARSGRRPSAAELDAWDDRLALAAERVHRRRREYLLGLGTRLGDAERMLLPEGSEIAVRYQPSPEKTADRDASQFAATFRSVLADKRSRDSALGFTADGPHRDEVEVTLSGVDLRKYGSAGQVRSAMLVLCAGKLSLLRDERREAPIFLMDDFDSDLDEPRTRSLLEFICGEGYQAIMATAKDGFLDRLGVPFHRIRMEGGLARAA
jgi:DNA replication and repair protein RecF